MVAVLLTALDVTARRLDVTLRVRRDPDVFVSGRNRQFADTIQRLLVADHMAFRIEVGEPLTRPLAPDARIVIVDVPKTRAASDIDVVQVAVQSHRAHPPFAPPWRPIENRSS